MNATHTNSIDANRMERGQHRNRLVVNTLAVFAACVLAVGCAAGSSETSPTSTQTSSDGTVADATISGLAPPAPTVPDQPPDPGDAQTEADEEAMFESEDFPGLEPFDNQNDGSDADGDGVDGNDNGQNGGGGPVDIPPGPPAAPHPCDNLVADGSSLVVHPDPVNLDSNDIEGEFAVTNCSDGDIAWTAAVNPKIALSTAGETTLPGESTLVSFVIDAEAYGDGSIDFKIKVSEPNHSQYVDVHAYNPRLGFESLGGNGTISAGEGVGGCSNQCIVSALLRSNVQTANISLDVTTDTPATVRVWVSTNAPQVDDGVPSFPGVDPIDVSGAGATAWTADLSPLQASTDYHIIVSATDGDDDVSYRNGTFRTRSPFDPPDGLADAGGDSGCATQCITSAVLSPGADYTSSALAVRSHTPALFQASVSTAAPSFDGSVPSFAAVDEWVNSGLEYTQEWDPTLDGLASNTQYHIIVTAQDAQGRTSYRVGQFLSQSAPTFDLAYTLVGIKVTNDGDKHSAGELSFGWQVGSDLVALDNAGKVDDGMAGLSTFTFTDWSSTWQVSDVSGFMPPVIVSAFEWDWNGNAFDGDSCNDVPESVSTSGFDGDCVMHWNVADTGLVDVASVSSLPLCTDFEEFGGRGEGLHCMLLTSESLGDNYPSITALVAIEIV